jgi:hypothetical protein
VAHMSILKNRFRTPTFDWLKFKGTLRKKFNNFFEENLRTVHSALVVRWSH